MNNPARGHRIACCHFQERRDRRPVELANENCLEAGGGWRDKSLGVWRIAEIG
jgi:hypothetical protein